MLQDAEIFNILRITRTIAMVGASAKTERPSYGVMQYLLTHGYEVVPVNPMIAGTTLMGQRVYATLADIPFPVDLVDVFRRSEEAAAVAEEAKAVHAKSLWLQLGVISPDARHIAKSIAMNYVQDRCIKIEHMRMKALEG